MAADYLQAQNYARYTAEDHHVWRLLHARQLDLVREFAAPEVLHGLEVLRARSNAIPRFEEINVRLMALTGWQIVGVPGLIPDEEFFRLLATRRFPVSVWIRGPHELDYLAEPDLFHDFFGHVALLTDPTFARFIEAYGAAGSKALSCGAAEILARLYWYTVEFGLMITANGLKAFGAGILSSHTETRYSVKSGVPLRLRFDLTRVMRTTYMINDLQKTYFVLDSFDELFHAGYDHDFAPIYARLGSLPPVAPGELLPGERAFTT